MLCIPDLLREAGIEPAPLLAQVGVPPDLFADAGNWIAFDALGHLVEQCTRATGNAHFGLCVGERFDLSALGPLGALMRHSATVDDALRGLVQFRHVGDRGAATMLINESASRTVLGYSIFSSNTPALRHIVDGAVAIAYRMLRELCGPSWQPMEVTFAHSAPADLAPFHRLFGPRVRFDADRSAVAFAPRWLRHRIAGADPLQYHALEAALRQFALRDASSMSEQARRALQSLVVAGIATAPAVAQMLGVHERQLRRQLLAEGTTFQQLGRRVQFEIAQQLLQETTLPVADVAAALHFSDATAFSRAFKAWAHMTPSAWRSNRPRKPARRVATSMTGLTSPQSAAAPGGKPASPACCSESSGRRRAAGRPAR